MRGVGKKRNLRASRDRRNRCPDAVVQSGGDRVMGAKSGQAPGQGR